MKRQLLAILAVLSTTCLAQHTPQRMTLEHDGHSRQYLVYTPAAYDASREASLMICLHGFNSDMYVFFDSYGIQTIADELNTVVIAPQALPEMNEQVLAEAELLKLLGINIPLKSVWGCGLRVKTDAIIYKLDAELNQDLDDVGFIRAALQQTLQHYNINPRNIFLLGTSMGAFMSYQYALHHGNELAGLIAICGSMGTSIRNQDADVKLPICDFHSLTDEVVPYSGIQQYHELFLQINISLAQSKNDVIDFWIHKNNASTSPTIENIQRYPATNPITVRKITYTSPQNPVVHYQIDGAPHSYYFRKENGDCMDYNEEIAHFINQHAHPVHNQTPHSTQPLHVYPNPATHTIHLTPQQGLVTIHSITGQLLLSTHILHGTLDITHIPKGIHIITLTNNQQKHQTKLRIH